MFRIYVDGKFNTTADSWEDANEIAWGYRLTHHVVTIVQA